MRKKKQESVKAEPEKVMYARRSHNASLFESQLERMREKWDPAGEIPVYVEEISGGKNRPILQKLLAELPEGSTIYCAHVDRLSRAGIIDFLLIVEKAKKRNISVYSMHDGEDDLRDQDPLMLALKGWLAQQEREACSRRMKDAVKERRKAHGGLWGGAIAKQRGVVWKPTKVANPVYQEALPFMRELRAEGFSYQVIADRASHRYGHVFRKAWVYQLLKEPQE